MFPYRLADAARTALIANLDKWSEDENFHQLEVVRKVGKSKNTVGTLRAEELAILADGAAIIDEIVERFGGQGGRFELRAVFQPETGPGTGGVDRKQLHRSFELHKARAEQRASSAGASAGIEQLTQSFGAAFDAQGRQLTASVQQQTQLMGLLLDRTEKHHTVHVQEITEYQRLIMEQQLELTEARIDLAYRDHQPMLTPEHLGVLLPAVVNLLGVLAEKLGASDMVSGVAGVAAAVVEGAGGAEAAAPTMPT